MRFGTSAGSPLHGNLRAAGRHVALGHESPSFRDCSHPLCCDAAGRVPFLQDEEAVLDEIYDRLQAELVEIPLRKAV